MNDKIEYLESLARLARESSSEGRRKLLREVTDLFMEKPKSLNESEIAYFGDIMGQIAFQVEMEVRRHLAETISAVSAAPRNLINRLANDSIEVARPVLIKSGVLKDADLIEIVKRHSQEHLLAISIRDSVSERVADALVEKGDDEVLGTLAGNAGARLSRDAMETIVTRSENNETLHEAFSARQDIPLDLIEKMFSHVTSLLREHMIAAGIGLDEAEVDGLLSETRDWFAAQHGDQELVLAEKFIGRKEKLNQLDDEFLLQLVRQGKVLEFVTGLAKLAKIELGSARQTVFDEKGEKLAIVCRAIDMDRELFAELIELTDFKNKRTWGEKKALLGVYARITPDSAQRALRFLRTRKRMQQKMEPAPGQSTG